MVLYIPLSLISPAAASLDIFMNEQNFIFSILEIIYVKIVLAIT